MLAAVDAGAESGLITWALTGRAPNPLAERVDDVLAVDSPHTATVQEIHLIAVHLSAPRSTRRSPARASGGPRRMSALIVVGDALLDRDLDGRAERLAPDAPVPVVDAMERHAGRAAPASRRALAAAAGHDVTLVCALGADAAGARVRELLEAAGVRGLRPRPARARRRRRSACARPAARSSASTTAARRASAGRSPREARAALAAADAVLVSDYGRGVAAEPSVRAALARAGATARLGPAPARAPEPAARVRARHAQRRRGPAAAGGARRRPPPRPPRRALRERLAARSPWSRHAGARGALLVGADGPPLAVPAPRVAAGDPCGAGDCFAATAAGRLAAGALPSEAVRAAVDAASAFVAAGGAVGLVRGRARRAAGAGGRPRARRAGARGGRHRRRHRRLLRPAARRARARARGRPRARRLPDRLPELRRLGAPAEGRRTARWSGERDRAAVLAALALRRRRRGVRRGRSARASCASCARMSGPRAATTRSPTCPRPRRSPSGAGAP